MKKLLAFLIVCTLCTALFLPVSAAEWVSDTYVSAFDEEPEWFDDATIVEFEDYYEEGETNARAGDHYVFLKNDGKGDFTIEFDVEEDGIYDIGIALMGWSKSVPRSTNVSVDGAPFVYIMYEYEDDSTQYASQYLTGLQMELVKGMHTFTMSLASDFDDSTVKSLYFDFLFYRKAADIPTADTEAATATPMVDAVEETHAPETSATSEPVTAPATLDAAILLAVTAMVASCGGYVACKKR